MEQFIKISKQKQFSIINAAYACFGRNGYKKASVADIALEAGISKASLFQYFGTKKELYLYLFQYAVDIIQQDTPKGSDDFFECLMIASQAKLRVLKNYPAMFDFMASTVRETDPEVAGELKRLNVEGIESGTASLFAGVDWSKFKPGVDRTQAVNIVTWVIEGYTRSNIDRGDIKKMHGEMENYLLILKGAFYK